MKNGLGGGVRNEFRDARRVEDHDRANYASTLGFRITRSSARERQPPHPASSPYLFPLRQHASESGHEEISYVFPMSSINLLFISGASTLGT